MRGRARKTDSGEQVGDIVEGVVVHRKLSQHLNLEHFGHGSVNDVSAHSVGEMVIEPQYWKHLRGEEREIERADSDFCTKIKTTSKPDICAPL